MSSGTAAAPSPLPPLNVIVGTAVYPDPGLSIVIEATSIIGLTIRCPRSKFFFNILALNGGLSKVPLLSFLASRSPT